MPHSRLLVLIVLLIVLSIALPETFAAKPTTTTKTTSTTTTTTTTSTFVDPADNLVPTQAAAKRGYSPHFTGTGPVADRGPITYTTTVSGFTWNKTSAQSLTIGTPSLVMATSLASLATLSFYSNSTTTQYRWSGFGSSQAPSNYFIIMSFKPNAYAVKISIDGSVGTATILRVPFVCAGAAISFTAGSTFIQCGDQIFTWDDVPSTYQPTWNNSTRTFTVALNGVFHVDPLALDGSSSCQSGVSPSCTITLSTSNANDIIVVNTACSSGAGCGTKTPTDTSSLSWTARTGKCNTGTWANNLANCGAIGNAEYYAVAASTLSSDVITCTDANVNGRVSCSAFGISGADTSTVFDSNVAVPCTATATSTAPACTISTSNTNDFIVGLLSSGAGPQITCAAPFTAIAKCSSGGLAGDGDGSAAAEYEVVSSTQSGLSVAMTLSASNAWTFIADAVKQASATVSQSIKITTANGAPSATITITGCSPSNSTFTANGNVKHYTLTASCTTHLANPTPSTFSRYEFDISPKPTPGDSVSVITCGTGTCTEYDNTTYYQLANNYTETAQSPTKWDAYYMDNSTFLTNANLQNYNSPTGTFVGMVVPNGSPYDLCKHSVLGLNHFEMTFQSEAIGACVDNSILKQLMWADYNTQTCLPTTIGNSWTAQGTHCWTDTTGNNTHTADYVQSTGTSSAVRSDNSGVFFLIAGGGFLCILLYAARKRR